MTQLVLHHYPVSPFAEKIRLILGYKQLPWTSVIIPNRYFHFLNIKFCSANLIKDFELYLIHLLVSFIDYTLLTIFH